jgi:hypothetical protein
MATGRPVLANHLTLALTHDGPVRPSTCGAASDLVNVLSTELDRTTPQRTDLDHTKISPNLKLTWDDLCRPNQTA